MSPSEFVRGQLLVVSCFSNCDPIYLTTDNQQLTTDQLPIQHHQSEQERQINDRSQQELACVLI